MAHTNVQLVSGNLTTGQASPTFFIDRVNDTVGIGGVPDITGDTSSNVLQVSGNMLATRYHGDGSNLTGLNDSKWLEYSGDASKIYYNGGNVGIGVASPGAELHVAGTGAIIVPSGTTDQQPTGVNGMIRYNSQTGYMEAYTVSGWGSIATPPSIVSISPLVVAVADTATQVFTVSGASFDSGLSINLVGADGTNYEVVDRTFVNPATATFKMGDLSSATAQLANRPYKVKVTGGSGLAVTSIQTIGFTGLSWTTQTLNSYSTTTSSTQNLVATDEVGGNNVTFSIYSGSMSGLSLGSTGASPATYGGSASSGTGGTPVTFRVTDNVTLATLDKTFSIVVTAPLYAFTSHTFTNAGQTGYTGPTLTQLRAVYSPAWTGYTSNLNVTTQGIQEWTVPDTGTYTIEALGASSGRNASTAVNDNRHAQGAKITGNFTLTKNTVLKILVGQKGDITGTGGSSYGGPGGGGTFVTYTNNTPLIVAGGGGAVGKDGPVSIAVISVGKYRSGANTVSGAPYNDGTSLGGSSLVSNNGCGGGGLTGSETQPNGSHSVNGGDSFISGGLGGVGAGGAGFGGFGGGGGRSGTGHGPGGGGGGYNGGDGGYYGSGQRDWDGHGGGSYNNGTSGTLAAQGPSGHNDGYVKITKI